MKMKRGKKKDKERQREREREWNKRKRRAHEPKITKVSYEQLESALNHILSKIAWQQIPFTV